MCERGGFGIAFGPGATEAGAFGGGLVGRGCARMCLAGRVEVDDELMFVDSITELTPGIYASAIWKLTGNETFFGGHFPGRPTLPGVLMCEAIAQTGALAIVSDPKFVGKLPLFGGLDGARFRRQVVPGDTLELSATISRMSARAGKGAGVARVNGEIACECELLFVVVDA